MCQRSNLRMFTETGRLGGPTNYKQALPTFQESHRTAFWLALSTTQPSHYCHPCLAQPTTPPKPKARNSHYFPLPNLKTHLHPHPCSPSLLTSDQDSSSHPRTTVLQTTVSSLPRTSHYYPAPSLYFQPVPLKWILPTTVTHAQVSPILKILLLDK